MPARWDPKDHPRDRNGRFISTGDSVTLTSGLRGTVVSLNDGGKVKVRTARGETVRVDPKQLGEASDSRETSLTGLEPATPEQRKALRIPPAWTDVLIHPDVSPASTNPDGVKILAVGRDGKGREQRVYSAAHAEEAAAKKFERVRQLATAGPRLDDHLSQRADADDSAGALLLIRRLGLRPGSTTDTGAEKQAYGASTLEARHVSVANGTATLSFTGKKGVPIELTTDDPQVVGLLERRAADKSGADRLFPGATDQSLRDELQSVLPGFKPKDLRTLVGTGEALKIVGDAPPPEPPDPADPKAVRAAKLEVAKRVSSLLGNTPSVALESYIDPTVFGRWEAPAAATKAAASGVSSGVELWQSLVVDHAAGISFFPPLPEGELPEDPEPEPDDDAEVFKVGERRYVRDARGRFSEIPGGPAIPNTAQRFMWEYEGRERRKLPNPRKRYGDSKIRRAAGRRHVQQVEAKRAQWMRRRAASMLQTMPANHPDRPYWVGVAEGPDVPAAGANHPAAGWKPGQPAPDGGLHINDVIVGAQVLVEQGKVKAKRDGVDRFVFMGPNGRWERKQRGQRMEAQPGVAAYLIRGGTGVVSRTIIEEDPQVKRERERRERIAAQEEVGRQRARDWVAENPDADWDAEIRRLQELENVAIDEDLARIMTQREELERLKQERGTLAADLPTAARQIMADIPAAQRQAAVDALRGKIRPYEQLDAAALNLDNAIGVDDLAAIGHAYEIGAAREKIGLRNDAAREGGKAWVDAKAEAHLVQGNIVDEAWLNDARGLIIENLNRDVKAPTAEVHLGALDRVMELILKREAAQREREREEMEQRGEHPAMTVTVPGDEAFLDAPVTDLVNLGGGVNTTKKGKIRGKAVVVKPIAGGYNRQLRDNIPKKSDLQRERGAYLIARAMGVPVPTTVVRPVEGEGLAVIQDWQVATVAGNATVDDLARVRQHPDYRLIAIFDAVIGNTDRHSGNWMIKRRNDGDVLQPIAIDHGLALPNGAMGAGNSQIQDDIAARQPSLTEAELVWLREVRDNQELSSQLAQSGLEQEAIDAMRKRLDVLIHDERLLRARDLDVAVGLL